MFNIKSGQISMVKDANRKVLLVNETEGTSLHNNIFRLGLVCCQLDMIQGYFWVLDFDEDIKSETMLFYKAK